MLQRKHVARRTMVAVFSGVALTGELGAQRGGDRELVELASRPLPSGFEVSGGGLSADGSIVYWSRDRKEVMVTNGQTAQRLCGLIALDPIAAAYVRSSTFEIVDAGSGRIFVATPKGDCRPLGALGPLGSISAAAYSSETDRWIALTIVNGTTLMASKGRGETTRRIALNFVRESELPMMHLTASRDGLALSSLRAPFTWTLVSWIGTVTATGRPFDADTRVKAGSQSSLSSRLFGMATHAVGDEFLQLLADPRSDLRVLVRYDAKGAY